MKKNVYRALSGNIQTNNRAELTAFIQANTVLDEDIDRGGNEKKIFYTDCMRVASNTKAEECARDDSNRFSFFNAI